MKSDRHREILNLINQNDISTQEELVKKLGERGFSSTQATVSRDIKQLKLSKRPSQNGKMCYAPGNTTPDVSEKYINTFKRSVISIEAAGNILVIKTEAGMAMAAAAALDEFGWPDIAGCIAGDNTVFVALRSADGAHNVTKRLKLIAE